MRKFRAGFLIFSYNKGSITESRVTQMALTLHRATLATASAGGYTAPLVADELIYNERNNTADYSQNNNAGNY